MAKPKKYERVGGGTYDIYRPKKKTFGDTAGEFIGGVIVFVVVLVIIGAIVG